MDFQDYAKRDFLDKPHPWGPKAAYYTLLTALILLPIALAIELV